MSQEVGKAGGPAFDLAETTNTVGAPFLRVLCEEPALSLPKGAGTTNVCPCEATPPAPETKSSSSPERSRRVAAFARPRFRGPPCYPVLVMSTAKQQVESLLHKLPENCSLEDIQYHLYVLDKVRHGLEDAKEQGTLSQDDVEKRLSQWLTE